jgi:hypothetical protein
VKRVLAATLIAIAAVPSAGHALDAKSFDFCGGTLTGYPIAFCASVNISIAAATPGLDANGLNHAVGAWTVSIDIINKSGENGTFLNAQFIKVGLDNLPIMNPAVDFADPANVAIYQNDALVCSNVTNGQQGAKNCYNVKVDQGSAGGYKVDFLATASTGVSNNAILSCGSTVVGGLHTCAMSPVTISFDVNRSFDLSSVQAYVKAQGELSSTECETGITGKGGCIPVTTTPEPASVTLAATGMAAALWHGRRRRRLA